MDTAATDKMKSLLSENEWKAFELFDTLVASKGEERERLALRLADVLGNPGEFAFYIQCSEDQRLIRVFHLLRVFRENVELLVHKTWVEAADEKPKELLLEDLSLFLEDFRAERMTFAFRRFVSVARAIPALLFGTAGRAPDFLDYALRIDPKFGLFFWYVGELERQMRSDSRANEDLYMIETLIGAYVLSCF